MGKLLMRGNGGGSSAITFWWVIEILFAAVFGGGGYYYSEHLRNQATTQYKFMGSTFESVNSRLIAYADYILYVGIFLAVLCIIFAILFHSGIAKTAINVYENGVDGMGAGKYFLWGDVRVFGFRLTYNQITSIDVTNNAIVIHASNSQYKCYASNSFEVQNAIFDQKNRKTSSSSGTTFGSNGDINARYNEAKSFYNNQQYDKAVPLFQVLANEGDFNAQAMLGWCISTGKGAVLDEAKAAEWYRKAADRGHASAQFNLGAFYENGQGVTRDVAKAIELYRMASAQGNTNAQKALDRLKAEGKI